LSPADCTCSGCVLVVRPAADVLARPQQSSYVPPVGELLSFFIDAACPGVYSLSLHDALPILTKCPARGKEVPLMADYQEYRRHVLHRRWRRMFATFLALVLLVLLCGVWVLWRQL